MKAKLTKRQQEVLDKISQLIRDFGWPPTRAELAKALGIASPNGAHEHLLAIQHKGYIEIVQGVSRGIRVLS